MQRRSGFSDIASPLCSGSNNNMRTDPPPKIRGYEHQGRRFIGDVAQPSEIDEDIQMTDIGSLRKGEPVWVKRSDKSWTYAIVEEREIGPHASIVITVSNHGAFKKLSMHQCAKFLRKVQDGGNEIDTSNTDTIPSTSSDTELDDSVRTFLDSLEVYFSQRQGDLYNQSRNHHAASLQRLVELICSHHDDKMQNSRLPMPNVEGFMPSISHNSIERHGGDANQPKRHVTFKLHDDHSLNSIPSANETVARDKNTAQRAKQSPTRRPMQPPPVARRSSWSTEIKRLLNIPNEKLNDPSLGGKLPRKHIDKEIHSYDHAPKTIHSLLSEVPPPPYGSRKNVSEDISLQDDKLSIPKKRLQDLDMGAVIPPKHGNARFESFQHALVSIHRRSSVFLPSEPGSGVTLH
jgi:hypothetical protein